jgi:hypothetical protein
MFASSCAEQMWNKWFALPRTKTEQQATVKQRFSYLEFPPG